MKLSIGILAHNEADSLPILLRSLWQQSWLQDLNRENFVEIIVIPNGCTDNTAEVAQEILTKLATKANPDLLQWKVCQVNEPGKSNAWNLFVHQFSADDTDFFCLMDADIQLYAPDTLAKMLDILVQNPEYWISLDRPIKDVELKKNKNFLEKLSVAVSKSSNEGQLYICGQLYCARASVLRSMWMPAGLPVEDGFLTQMVISENFTLKNPTFDKRIVRVTEASHIFAAYTNPWELINHEVRVVVGIVINSFLTCYFQERCNQKLTAGKLIAKMNSENHFWLNDFVKNSIPKRSWWIIPISLVFRRYRSLKNHSLFKALLRIPIATLAFIVDLVVFIRANSKLHGEVITNYW
ncbi:MAG TPA: glycosyltransferase family 2 protein [Coleofasciculaceae cyanobacterium]|jgi:glycosyltransferase involved in cell wall biosynthesis